MTDSVKKLLLAYNFNPELGFDAWSEKHSYKGLNSGFVKNGLQVLHQSSCK